MRRKSYEVTYTCSIYTEPLLASVERPPDPPVPPIPAGEIFAVVAKRGYDGNSFYGVYRAKQEISRGYELRDDFLTLYPEWADGVDGVDEKRFLAWLADKGMIEAIEHCGWDLCSWDAVEPDEW